MAGSADVDFRDKFQRGADKYDRVFVVESNEYYRMAFVFVSFISASTSLAIVTLNGFPGEETASLSLPQVAYLGMSQRTLTLMYPMEWPDPTAVHVRATLFSSLTTPPSPHSSPCRVDSSPTATPRWTWVGPLWVSVCIVRAR